MSCQIKAGPDEPLPPGKLLQVITYLEMGAPPGQRPSQVNPEGIRVARSVHITADFYRHLYQSVGKVEQVLIQDLHLTVRGVMEEMEVEVLVIPM